MRLILRPGCHVLRRGEGELQVGLDPHRAVVLPDTESVRTSLRLLADAADHRSLDPATLGLLDNNGLLIDEARLMPLIPVRRPATGGSHLSRRGVAALALRSGDDLPGIVEARSGCAVEVVSFGDSEAWEARLGELLHESGMTTAEPRRGSGGTASVSPTRAGALVGVGEPHRELTDVWVRTGTPHVIVRTVEGSVTVGPLVVPGRTACLRCLDAHRTDADPSWPLLLAQYSTASARDRADGVPEPVDAALVTIALAWAVRDLASLAEGRRPSTWSTTIRFDPCLTAVESQSWLRHPACGCSWG
jgi:bacteriocin biosynthesis cyclodehydratase domain-containing protein